MPELPVYDSCQLTPVQRLAYGAAGVGAAMVFAWLFFNSIWAFLFMAPFGVFYPVTVKKKLARKRKEKLLLQWKEAVLSIGVSLSAGYSAENAMEQAWRELERRFGKDQDITREFAAMSGQINMNVPVEKVLEDFAVRSGLDEIKSFAEIFRIARRSGADLVRIVTETAEIIASRVEVKEEILTMMTTVRLEGTIMNLVPLCILAYINLNSPQFFSPMYETLVGRAVMVAGFAGYLGICAYSGKLMEVEL